MFPGCAITARCLRSGRAGGLAPRAGGLRELSPLPREARGLGGAKPSNSKIPKVFVVPRFYKIFNTDTK